MDQVTGRGLIPWPEAVVAAMTLRSLPGVHSDVPIGWAPAALAVVAGHLANRPGSVIFISKDGGGFSTTFAAGTLVDAEAEVYPHPGSWYGGEIAMHSCELCARPGRRHRVPDGVFCDSCVILTSGDEPDFAPRLPLAPDVEDAYRTLPPIRSLVTVPAGWAPLVRSVLKRLGDGSGADLVFADEGDHLVVVSAPDAADRIAAVNRTLVTLTRERCRYCGRPVEESSFSPGACDGCLAVQARGWETTTEWRERQS
ncbi:hypothetical protein BJ963_003592 [Leifsonia soli]|uniref:Uncharacterized protein n=1 Tax=Leifsonia soli TaxID=582665 RepID=A0A852T5J7_9MICO|nr:hypothetical protein [Leifsonia soli]